LLNRFTLPRFHGSTVQPFNRSTIQRFHASTVPGFANPWFDFAKNGIEFFGLLAHPVVITVSQLTSTIK